MPLPSPSPSPAASPFNSTDKPWTPPAGDTVSGPAPAWTPPAGDVVSGPWDKYKATPSPFNSEDKPADTAWTPPAGDKVAGPLNNYAPQSPALPVSTNPIDAARNSAGAVVSGLGKFGNVIDSAIVKTLPPFAAKALGASGDLASGTDQAVINAGTAISGPNQYQPSPVHQLGADVMAGRPLSALNDAAGVVAGAVPYAATALIPGAGPVLLGASGAGNTIAAREQAKGTTTPSFGDVAAGAASGALNAVGGSARAGE